MTNVFIDKFNLFPLLSLFCLRHNELSSIPYEIQNLSSLQVLRVDGNKLSELPETIIHLSSLETLVRIIDINFSVFAITLPVILCVQSANKNSLTGLPPDLGLLLRLRSLNVSENSLTSLPESLGKMRGMSD